MPRMIFPVPPQIPTPRNRRHRRAVARLDRIVYGIIEHRRANGGDRGDGVGPDYA